MTGLPDVVLMSDARIMALPVHDDGEPLVDTRSRTPELLQDGRRAAPDAAHAHVRLDVALRLAHACTLLPPGTSLVLVEGYRPLDVQDRYFSEYRSELAALHDDWSDDELHAAASRYVSPPDIAPHCAGAAVDVTLVGADGELDLGTRINASPEESDGRCYTAHPGASPEAQRNRSLLANALGRAGFVNYPTEWWHWSYGDRYWAWTTGRASARYGHTSWPPTRIPG